MGCFGAIGAATVAQRENGIERPHADDLERPQDARSPARRDIQADQPSTSDPSRVRHQGVATGLWPVAARSRGAGLRGAPRVWAAGHRGRTGSPPSLRARGQTRSSVAGGRRGVGQRAVRLRGDRRARAEAAARAGRPSGTRLGASGTKVAARAGDRALHSDMRAPPGEGDGRRWVVLDARPPHGERAAPRDQAGGKHRSMTPYRIVQQFIAHH